MDNKYYFNKTENVKKLFFKFTKYKDLPYEEFIENINRDLNTKYTLSDLKKYIIFMTKCHSTSQGKTMQQILKYVLSGNKDTKLEKELHNLDEKYYYLKTGKVSFVNRYKEKPEFVEKKQQSLADINKEIDIVIDNKDVKPSELYEHNKISNRLLTIVKSNLKELDSNKYVDFIEAYFNIESTSKEELHQYIETINYFIKNLEKSLYRLNLCDLPNDEAIVRSIKVTGEDELNDYYLNNIYRLHAWKIGKIIGLLERYNKMKNNLEGIIESESIKEFELLKDFDLKQFKEDAFFVYEYYKQLLDIKKVYDKNIKNLNTINDNKKNEIDNTFVKKLLFENNN